MGDVVSFLLLTIFVVIAWSAWSEVRRWATDRDRAGVAAHQWLQANLAGWVEVPVERTVLRSQGNDITLEMGSWGTLRMRCLWPRTVEVRSLRRAFFHDDIGWIIDGVTAAEEPVRFYASYAFHYPHAETSD